MYTSARYYNCQEAKETNYMLSKQGMFDQIQTLRNETHRHFDLITSRQVQTLWNIYQKCTKHEEFRGKAKNYLNW